MGYSPQGHKELDTTEQPSHFEPSHSFPEDQVVIISLNCLSVADISSQSFLSLFTINAVTRNSGHRP